MKKHLTFTLLPLVLLAGCSTQASRMADCQAQGISKDACYIVEMNHQESVRHAAEIQALHNAAAQYAQSARKSTKHVARIDGVDIKIYPDDKQGYIESTAAALIEENQHVQVYQKGVFKALWYKLAHKIVLLRYDHFVGSAKA